ncbi:hypothetical protein BpHYR1_028593, partial [Brachionus plicatilis]
NPDLENRICCTKRYSLENYLYDPVLICSDYKTSNYQQYDADYNTLINELKKFLDIEKKIQEFKDQKEITDQDHFNSYIHSLNGMAPVEIKYPEILNILRGHEIEKAFENIYSNGK